MGLLKHFLLGLSDQRLGYSSEDVRSLAIKLDTEEAKKPGGMIPVTTGEMNALLSMRPSPQ